MVLPLLISDIEEHWIWYSLLSFRTSWNTGHGTPSCHFGHRGTLDMVLPNFGHRGTLDMVLPIVISDIEEHWTWYSLFPYCHFGHRGTLDMILPIVISDIEEHRTWYSLFLFRTSRNTGHGTPTLFRLQRVNTNSKIN